MCFSTDGTITLAKQDAGWNFGVFAAFDCARLTTPRAGFPSLDFWPGLRAFFLPASSPPGKKSEARIQRAR